MEEVIDPVLNKLQSLMKPATWERRLQKARVRMAIVEAVARLRSEGMTEEEALQHAAPGLAGSTFRRLRLRYEQGGLVALISRSPSGTGPQKLTPVIREVIAALRKADPNIGVEQIASVLHSRFALTLGATNIKRVLREEGLSRLPGGGSKREPVCEELQFAGAVFFQLADQELGCSAGLAETIVELARSVPAPDPDAVLRDEQTGRDDHGHFAAAYNQARAKGDANLGPSWRSVEEKRNETDLRSRKLAREQLDTVQRKVQACLAMPLLTETSRTIQLDDYRGGHGITEFCGHRYTGDTVDRFLRDLKYFGLAGALSEYHAGFWLEHESPGTTGAYIYLDGVSKPLCTSLFTKAGKVSSNGRVMPCLDQALVCTGMGTPLFWQSFSGHGSLVSQTLPLLERLEAVVGKDWMAERLVVIDGEANAVGLFKQFDDKGRLFITILRDNQVPDLDRVEEITAWMPYRNGDEIAEGWVRLNDSNDKKAPYRVRVILIRRRRKGTLTVLVTNAKSEDYGTEVIANAYFRRWPAQELRFRTFNQGTRFKAVHGYGKRLVQNVAVLSKLDELHGRKEKLAGKITKQALVVKAVLQGRTKARRQLNVAKARRNRHDALVAKGMNAPELDRETIQNRIEVTKIERERFATAEKAVKDAEQAVALQQAKLEKLQRVIPELTKEIATLESRREIFQADTELDSIMTTFKLFFVLICEFVVREYFDETRLSLHGFMRQILSLPGTRTIEGKVEHIRIKASPNKEIMQAVELACKQITARGCMRNGRTVRLSVQWADPAQTSVAKRKG